MNTPREVAVMKTRNPSGFEKMMVIIVRINKTVSEVIL